jgi:hypothetical protein
MADHRVQFALGYHIRFGSLDFLYMGVDHDLVLLPPSMLVDPTFPLGSNECIRELDPASTEGSTPCHPLLGHPTRLTMSTPLLS